MDDLIRRRAAIDALEHMLVDPQYPHTGEDWYTGMNSAESAIYGLPSAQLNRLVRAVAGKSPEETYEFLYWLMFDYARTFTDSRAAVIAWLKGEPMADPIDQQAAVKEAVIAEEQDYAVEALENLPSAQPKKQASDEIYGMMKDYYFKHRNDHDESWQGGFAKCMNLIPNMYERKEND